MKAAVIHEFGDFDVLKYEDVPTPKAKTGNVVIKVLAAGLNRFDHYISNFYQVVETRTTQDNVEILIEAS